MEERSLDPKAEEETEAVGQAENSESEETEEEEASEDESLEALVPKLTEKQRKELETLTKKAKDFDGLAAKRRKLEVKKPDMLVQTSVTEDAVRSVLYKDNEKKALREVINPKSPMFIAELVEDKNFTEIVAYLPRSIDKSSPESIQRALKLATRMWKEDRGDKEEKKKPEAELASTRGQGGGSERPEVVRKERTFLKKTQGLDAWYKKE